jgi:excisionase family DNA binding protein
MNTNTNQSDQTTTSPRRLEGPLLRPAEVAGLLAVKTSWVYEAVRTGVLPCLRIGKHVRFTRPMLEDWLATR